MFINFPKKRKGGFLVLTMVLLVCTSVLAVVTGILLRSIGEINMSGDSENSLKASNVVNACAEHALLHLSTTTDGLLGWNYLGDEELSVGDEKCYIYTLIGSTSKTINASSTVDQFTKKVTLVVATNTPNVKVTYWEEVADF
jgi:hypothetical protein